MRNFSLAVVCSVSLMGCYKTNLVNFPDSGSPGTEVKVWQHNLLVGLVPLTDVDVAKACGSKGVYSVTTQMSFVQLLLSGFTSAIYAPTTAKITCRG